jgi:hypothetical protein
VLALAGARSRAAAHGGTRSAVTLGMVIGQLGAAFAAKAVAPRISLGTLFFAAMALELVGPLEDAPVLVVVAPLAIGVGYQVLTRQAEAAIVVAACVLGYAVAGLLPDAADCALFAVGVALYLWRTSGIDRFGTLGAWLLAAVVIAARAMDWTLGAIGTAALIALATWIDRHRERRPAMQPAARVPCRRPGPPAAGSDPPAEAAAAPSPSPLP